MLSGAKWNFNFCNEVFLVASILNSNTDVKVNCQADFNHKEREECRLFFALFAFFAVKILLINAGEPLYGIGYIFF